MSEDNPYLAHLNKKGKGKGGPVGENEPLFGFVPRMVTGEQARKAIVSPAQTTVAISQS